MIEQLHNAIRFLAFFVAAKTGKAGLAVTVDVYDPTGTQIVSGAQAVEIGGGLYGFTLAPEAVSMRGEYLAIFRAEDDSVDQKHIPSAWTVGRSGVENLDAPVSSRNALAPDNAWIETLGNRLTDARAALLDKLNVGEPEQPVFIVPAPPADVSVCRVFGYLETVDDKPAADITVSFELLAPDPVRSERLISGRHAFAKTDAAGQLTANGNPYLELQRNDKLSKPGTRYRVTCGPLNLSKEITLTTETFDLSDIV
jgi:hypothetical protein